MYCEDSLKTFFGVGRCVGLICNRIDEFLSNETQNLDALLSLRGEWCFFYYKKDTSQLIFGRDIFARKSLCWRINKERSTLELSTFPAFVKDDWKEVYSGTFFVLNLSADVSVEVEENFLIAGHYALRCSSVESSISTGVYIVSYNPLQKLEEDDEFIRLFNNFQFIPLPSDHVLKPTCSVVEDYDGQLMQEMCVEFHRRLLESVRAVGASLVSLSSGRIAVLFSGGVDSLAVALAAGYVAVDDTEILLINVAFGESAAECGKAPDRQRSINAFKHIRSTKERSNIIYRLVLVDVGRAELTDCRRRFIAQAIAPCRTVLDDSIGCVLWFATRARGVEFLEDNLEHPPVDFSGHDQIDLVLVGSGADEQLGGYVRHQTIFQRFGYQRLADELAMEMSRIGLRNFGRDDRVGTSNGRTIVAPYLEEPFVEWLNGVPLSLKINFSLPRGEGEKLLLRQTLIQVNGVSRVLAGQPKQAMQFGTRIAKMENHAGDKGSDTCDRLVMTTADCPLLCQ